MLKYKGGMIPSPVIEVQYADGIALKLSFWCDKKKGIDPQAGIRLVNLVHASSAWDKANAARLEKAYYHPPVDERGNRTIDADKAVRATQALYELNAERVAFVRQCTDQPLTAFITHPSIHGRWRPDQFETAMPKRKVRMFDVTYVVTRSEVYRIQAADEDEAQQTAFEEGQQIDMGETTAVDYLGITEIPVS